MANTYNSQAVNFYPTPMLVGDYVATSGGSVDSVPQMLTAVNVSSGQTVPVTACASYQSAQAGFLMPQLSTATMTASSFTPYPGMIAYNTTVKGYQVSHPAVTGATADNFSPVGIYTVSGVMTPAQFIAAYATPVTLIPSPGANGVIMIRSFYLELIWTALNTQYTLGGAVSLQYGTTAHAGGTLATATIAAADINAAVASTLFTAAPALPGEASAVATFANLGISISMATAFATGNSPIRYYVEYSIMPV